MRKDYRDLSRQSWSREDTGLNIEDIKLGALLRIADSLESIKNTLNCPRLPRTLDAIIRIEKRMATRTPLRRKKSP